MFRNSHRPRRNTNQLRELIETGVLDPQLVQRATRLTYAPAEAEPNDVEEATL